MSTESTQKFMVQDRRLAAAQQFEHGRRRAPRPQTVADARRDLWAGVTAAALIVALMLAAAVLFSRTVGAPDYGSGLPIGQGGGLPVAAQGNYEWNRILPRVSGRVIEVRNLLPGGQRERWNVKAAERWLDGYTLSEMKTVKRCSGKAYRCITVRAGRVGGASVGWAERGVITIDTGKASRRGEYRSASVRKWLLVHELAHTFGLKHSAGRHAMNPTPGPGRLSFTKQQRQYLAAR